MSASRPLLSLIFIFFVAGCGGGNAPDQPVSESTESSNPFLAESTLLDGLPHFDLIKDEHYVPALERGMAEEMNEVEAIAANPASATIENTVVAMELTGQLLNRRDSGSRFSSPRTR